MSLGRARQVDCRACQVSVCVPQPFSVGETLLAELACCSSPGSSGSGALDSDDQEEETDLGLGDSFSWHAGW